MKFASRFLKTSLFLAMILAFPTFADAQDKTGKAAKSDKLSSFVKKSGMPNKDFGDNVWTLDHEGKTIFIGADSDIVVVFMMLGPVSGVKVNGDSMSALLRLANELDQVKFIIDDDKMLAVRHDSQLRLLDQAAFDDAVLRVINGYQKATAKLSPYLIK